MALWQSSAVAVASVALHYLDTEPDACSGRSNSDPFGRTTWGCSLVGLRPSSYSANAVVAAASMQLLHYHGIELMVCLKGVCS